MTIYGSVMDEINSRGIDCVPMSPHVQEVRMDAIRQTEEAFKGGRKQLYAAMEVVGEVLLYARNREDKVFHALHKADAGKGGDI